MINRSATEWMNEWTKNSSNSLWLKNTKNPQNYGEAILRSTCKIPYINFSFCPRRSSNSALRSLILLTASLQIFLSASASIWAGFNWCQRDEKRSSSCAKWSTRFINSFFMVSIYEKEANLNTSVISFLTMKKSSKFSYENNSFFLVAKLQYSHMDWFTSGLSRNFNFLSHLPDSWPSFHELPTWYQVGSISASTLVSFLPHHQLSEQEVCSFVPYLYTFLCTRNKTQEKAKKIIRNVGFSKASLLDFDRNELFSFQIIHFKVFF